MSKQITAIMQRFPHIAYDVSYEGDDGIWLYMRPGWYCGSSDCGTIHESTVRGVIQCFRNRFYDPKRWVEEHPDDHFEIDNIRAGKYK